MHDSNKFQLVKNAIHQGIRSCAVIFNMFLDCILHGALKLAAAVAQLN
jgi:hypothetical protein